jgi:hypothetical protein
MLGVPHRSAHRHTHRGGAARDVCDERLPRGGRSAAGQHEDGHVPAPRSCARRRVALSCAGCHTHSQGDEPLRVSVDGCALCHLSRLDGSEPADCRVCHQQPQHVALTSQALPIPHSALPWVETGCVRCHYDVAEPPTRVAMSTCAHCHGRDTTIIARGIATDLHPTHTSVSCTACHQGEAHRVRAMSSAVARMRGLPRPRARRDARRRSGRTTRRAPAATRACTSRSSGCCWACCPVTPPRPVRSSSRA